MMGTVLFYQGQFNESRDHYARGIAVADGDPLLMLPDGRDPQVACRGQLGRVMWLLGHPDEARTLTEDALARARRAEQPLALAFALFLDMLRREVGRDVDGTRRCSQELLTLADEHDLPQYRAWAGIVHGWAVAATDPAAGVSEIQHSLAVYERLRSEVARPHFLALLAEAMGRDGRVDEGLGALDEAVACAARTGDRYYLAEVHRLRGELSLRASTPARRETAAAAFADAVREAQEQEARAWELRARLSEARAARLAGNEGSALATLTAVYRTFSEGLNEPDLRDTRQFIDESTGANGP
jgi:predicted ATPase